MTIDIESTNTTVRQDTWQLNALTEALGDLTLTVDDSLSIGRGSDNDVVLGSKQVSRNHAVLSVLDGQLYVKDLDSSNGTFINDQRIDGNQSSPLQVDDTLGFASFIFQVHTLSTEEVTSTPVVPDDTVATSTEAVAEETIDEHAVTEAPLAEQTVKEEPIIEKPVVEEDITGKPITEKPIIVETGTLETSTEEPSATVSEPVIKQTGIEDVLSATDNVETVPVETVPVDTTSDIPVGLDNTSTADDTADMVEPATQKEPVVKETGIEEVLSAADDATLIPTEDTPVTTEPAATVSVDDEPLLEQEPVVEQQVVHEEEPVVEQPAVHEEPAVQADHDKTTKTELQEEADPDVLCAKQAATAQFSGTANLGQSRDLGTEGNNAMDQQISNPANTGQIEKKPSGSWFVWVFAAILIVGLALWLFNKGIV